MLSHTKPYSLIPGLALILALAGNASTVNANTIEIIEESTQTHAVTVTTTIIKDSAEVEITGPDWTASHFVLDGHPSIAEVTAPASPWGGPYARGKAFGDGDSGETWTAFLADANGPDTYQATVLRAAAAKTVTVENLTSSVRTVTVTIILVPELAAVAWDAGVTGDLAVIYRARLDESTVVYEKNMTFSGNEIGQPSVIKDGIVWNAVLDPFIPNLGPFDHAFIMDGTPIEIPVDIMLGPNESRDIVLTLESEILTPDPAATTGMGFLGATSNSIPLDLNEPNDTPEDATPLVCGDARFEPVLTSGDVDNYRLDAPFGTIVDVIVETSTALAVQVFDGFATPLVLWPIDVTDGTLRRFIASGSGDVLTFASQLDAFYTLFVTCHDAPLPPLPGDLFAVTPQPNQELMRINPTNGDTVFQAPLAGPFGDITDLVIDPQRGALIGLAGQSNQLVDIDPILGQQFPRCQLPPVGLFTEMAQGPNGLWVVWVDPQNQLFLGELQPEPDFSGQCQVTPLQSLPFIDIGGLAFDPLANLLFGCTGPFDPLGPQVFGLDPLSGQMLPPLQAPGFCGGLDLIQQAILPGEQIGSPTLMLVTAPGDAMPGQLFAIDPFIGDIAPIGDTGTGGLIALAIIPGTPPADTDLDGVPDPIDNCVAVANADQTDADGDSIGNICDADLNQDCIVNVADLGLLRVVFFTDDATADLDANGVVNVVDLGILRTLFFQTPGPSGLPNACTP